MSYAPESFKCSFKHLAFLSQGSGALAILVMAFTAGTAWRKQGWGDSNPVTETLASLWVFFQPLLFSLIGAEVDCRHSSSW